MATIATTTLIDGKIEIPADTQRSKHLEQGTRFQIIETVDGILLRAEESTSSPIPAGTRSLGELLRADSQEHKTPTASGDWRRLEGILADDGIDTTEQKQREREWELSHDERKFVTPRPTW